MKHWKRIWLSLLLLPLLLTGCQTAESQPKAVLPLNEAAARALNGADQLIEYTADDLADMTGILPEMYTEAVFLMDSDTLSGREAVIVRAKDADSLKTVRDALNTYLAQRMQETRAYLPDAYKLQSEARVDTKNLTAALIIGPDAAAETRALLAGE